MEEEFYFEDSNTKATIIKCVIILIIIVGAFITFSIYKKNTTFNIKKVVKYEVGSKLDEDLSKYVNNKIVDKKDYKLYLNKVDNEDGILTKTGEFEYKVKYNSITKKGIIKVVDTKPPKVETVPLTVGLNEELELSDFILSCEDYSKPCNVDYVTASDANFTKKEGTYKFRVKVSDQFDNSIKKEVNLTVKKNVSKENRMISDLNISYIDPKYKDYNNTFLIKLDKGIEEDELFGSDILGKLNDIAGSDLHQYIPDMYANNLITSSDVIYVYNKYGYVIGFTIRVELDNKEVFYLTK